MAEPRKGAQPFAVGCLLAIPGFFGGGMIGMAIAKLVDDVTGCKPPEGGWPACNGGWYLLVGAVIGLVLLPSVVVWRLRRGGGPENRP